MDFKRYLSKTAGALDQEIEKFLKKRLKEAESTDKKLVPLFKAFIASCRGGKRIRGTLVKLGYELVKGNSEEIIKIGVAYEIFHSSILAHDDIIDQSPIRRGKHSLYKIMGVSQAITLADYGFFLAIKIITGSKFPQKVKNEALSLFAKIMADTAMGQMLDIAHADPKLVAKLKTARYSISGPLKLGAILGGKSLGQLDKLDKFGENLGIAYQIRDDILDGEALVHAQDQVLEYTELAKKLIPQITKDKQIINLLQELTEYLVERKK